MSLFMSPRPLALGCRPKISMEDFEWYRYRRRRIAAFSLGLLLADDERASISILQTPVQLSPLNGTTFQLCSKDKVAPLTGPSRTWSRPLSTSSDISFLVVEFGKLKKKKTEGKQSILSYPIRHGYRQKPIMPLSRCNNKWT